MNVEIFYRTTIHKNGWLECLGNYCLTPVHGVMQCLGGNNYKVRYYLVNPTHKQQPVVETLQSDEKTAYKVCKHILSFIFFIPGFIVGSIIKGLAQLNAGVVEKNKLLAHHLKHPIIKSIYPHVLELFGFGLERKVLSWHQVNLNNITSFSQISPKDLGTQSVVQANVCGQQVVLVRYIRRFQPDETIVLKNNVIHHQQYNAIESVLVINIYTNKEHVPTVYDINEESPLLWDLRCQQEVNWLRKLLDKKACGLMQKSGDLRIEGKTRTDGGHSVIHLWNPLYYTEQLLQAKDLKIN